MVKKQNVVAGYALGSLAACVTADTRPGKSRAKRIKRDIQHLVRGASDVLYAASRLYAQFIDVQSDHFIYTIGYAQPHALPTGHDRNPYVNVPQGQPGRVGTSSSLVLPSAMPAFPLPANVFDGTMSGTPLTLRDGDATTPQTCGTALATACLQAVMVAPGEEADCTDGPLRRVYSFLVAPALGADRIDVTESMELREPPPPPPAPARPGQDEPELDDLGLHTRADWHYWAKEYAPTFAGMQKAFISTHIDAHIKGVLRILAQHILAPLGPRQRELAADLTEAWLRPRHLLHIGVLTAQHPIWAMAPFATMSAARRASWRKWVAPLANLLSVHVLQATDPSAPNNAPPPILALIPGIPAGAPAVTTLAGVKRQSLPLTKAWSHLAASHSLLLERSQLILRYCARLHREVGKLLYGDDLAEAPSWSGLETTWRKTRADLGFVPFGYTSTVALLVRGLGRRVPGTDKWATLNVHVREPSPAPGVLGALVKPKVSASGQRREAAEKDIARQLFGGAHRQKRQLAKNWSGLWRSGVMVGIHRITWSSDSVSFNTLLELHPDAHRPHLNQPRLASPDEIARHPNANRDLRPPPPRLAYPGTDGATGSIQALAHHPHLPAHVFLDGDHARRQVAIDPGQKFTLTGRFINAQEANRQVEARVRANLAAGMAPDDVDRDARQQVRSARFAISNVSVQHHSGVSRFHLTEKRERAHAASLTARRNQALAVDDPDAEVEPDIHERFHIIACRQLVATGASPIEVLDYYRIEFRQRRAICRTENRGRRLNRDGLALRGNVESFRARCALFALGDLDRHELERRGEPAVLRGNHRSRRRHLRRRRRGRAARARAQVEAEAQGALPPLFPMPPGPAIVWFEAGAAPMRKGNAPVAQVGHARKMAQLGGTVNLVNPAGTSTTCPSSRPFLRHLEPTRYAPAAPVQELVAATHNLEAVKRRRPRCTCRKVKIRTPTSHRRTLHCIQDNGDPQPSATCLHAREKWLPDRNLLGCRYAACAGSAALPWMPDRLRFGPAAAQQVPSSLRQRDDSASDTIGGEGMHYVRYGRPAARGANLVDVAPAFPWADYPTDDDWRTDVGLWVRP